MIRLFHVTKSYGPGPPALNDINLRVDKGEFVFIMGPSGAGKTTLLRLLFCKVVLPAACDLPPVNYNGGSPRRGHLNIFDRPAR